MIAKTRKRFEVSVSQAIYARLTEAAKDRKVPVTKLVDLILISSFAEATGEALV